MPPFHAFAPPNHRPGRRRLRHVCLVAAVTLLSLLAACSDDDASTPADTTESPASTTGDPSDAEAAPEQFTGDDDDFYVVPDPLPPGEPGQLIRVQDLGESDGYVDLRVMYHSRDARDQDRAVTGIISYPTAEAPEGGWPVIALAHGTTGLGSQCAPSRFDTSAPGFGIEGVRVATDYVGLGPVGEVHPYLSGLSEAQPVLDSVRAARLLPEANASERFLGIGHSQGGHAALFTHDIAEEYAPELEHLGTIVSAPAAALDQNFGPDDEVVPRMVGLMALYGIAQDNPDLDPAEFAGEELAANDELVTTGCTDEIVEAFVTIPPDDLYETHPLDDPEAREILMANDPGAVVAEAPMLLLYGTLDWWVVPDRVKYVFDQVCDAGQATELVEVPTGDHGNLLGEADDTITDWFEARLSGEPATDSCEGN